MKAKYRKITRAKRSGDSIIVWVTLSCGHLVEKRYRGRLEDLPKKARCPECEAEVITR